MTSFANSISSFAPPERRIGSCFRERAFVAALWSTGVLAGLCCVAVAAVLAIGAWPALSEAGLLAFLSDAGWHPTSGQFGLAPMVAATLIVSGGALAVAGPLSVLCALFIVYYAGPRLAGVFGGLLLLLSGVPSVVYGLWGMVVLVPWIAERAPPGASVLAGIVVLSIMILPTIAVVACTALEQLPPGLYQGAVALGLPRPVAIRRVVLPAVQRRLMAAGMLGLARAQAETMAVLMVTGNAIAWPSSPFASVRVLSANVLLEMAYALAVHRSALFVSALALLAIVSGLVAISGRLETAGADDEA